MSRVLWDHEIKIGRTKRERESIFRCRYLIADLFKYTPFNYL